MTLRLTFLSLLAACPVMAQMPSAVVLPQLRTRYISGQAWDLGTNYSAHCNEISSTNRSLQLAWTPSPTPGTVTVIESGWSPGNYTLTNCVGTNSTTRFPVPVPPAPWFLEWGGEVVIAYTNAVLPCQFFQATNTTGGDWFDIADATNVAGPWSSAYRIFPIGDGTGFTFTTTP